MYLLCGGDCIYAVIVITIHILEHVDQDIMGDEEN